MSGKHVHWDGKEEWYIKQALEDSTAALGIQQRDATVVHPTRVPSATVQSSQRYPFLSVYIVAYVFLVCGVYLSRFVLGLFQMALMHSLVLPENQHTFNSHLNYLNLWGLKIELDFLGKLLWEVYWYTWNKCLVLRTIKMRSMVMRYYLCHLACKSW